MTITQDAHTSSHFYKYNCENGKFRVECALVIYQAAGKPYPDFLDNIKGDPDEGYNTKFYIALTDDIDDAKKIITLVKKYRRKYDKLLTECENTGDWSKFPFDPNADDFEICYYK